MSVAVRQRPGGGLDVTIRTRLRDGTKVRVCVKSPLLRRSDACRRARAHQSALERASSPAQHVRVKRPYAQNTPERIGEHEFLPSRRNWTQAAQEAAFS